MERITGPYKGHFIAAYSVKAGTSFAGYAKVCAHEPESVWSDSGVEKLTSAAGFRTELEAVMAAEAKARHVIVDLIAGWDTTSAPGELS